ncbi:MAG: glycosyltransferase family 2 protein [Proteobacteria bacterium]|nr:glycosyltransferase family 2 protein [Pseudomonadota bacterium]
MNLFGLISVRNEERYLPGFLYHLAPYVNAIVALDDCSTDATLDILRSERKVVSVLRENRAGPPHGHEVSNRYRLLCEAARLGADWVICADADERFEERFLRRLRTEAKAGDKHDKPVRLFQLVNLWNSPHHYRVDGLCKPRGSARMFRLPMKFSQRDPGMHQPWFPPEMDEAPRANMHANLYHLRMIERKDREVRFEKFRSVDPNNRDQAVGYNHLIDETDLTLKRIPLGRGYVDLPKHLRRSSDTPLPSRRRSFCGWRRPARLAKPLEAQPLATASIAPNRPVLLGLDFQTIFADRRLRNS